MRFVLFLPALLAGCATQIPADQASNWDVCRHMMGGGQYAVVAQQEAQRRGLDCAPYFPAIIQQRQAESAALQDAARYFAPRPMQLPPPPMQTNCTTRQVGNTLQTSCF
jgi:hypothetical protein